MSSFMCAILNIIWDEENNICHLDFAGKLICFWCNLTFIWVEVIRVLVFVLVKVQYCTDQNNLF